MVVWHTINMSSERKRPNDSNQLAKLIVDIATGDASEPKETPQAERARKAGKQGGQARAENLTPEKRTEIARHAAKTRWQKDASE